MISIANHRMSTGLSLVAPDRSYADDGFDKEHLVKGPTLELLVDLVFEKRTDHGADRRVEEDAKRRGEAE
jgi:hypothetical protein